MATTPPIYSATTGYLTDYGVSIGAKAVQPGDPRGKNTTQSTNVVTAEQIKNGYTGSSAATGAQPTVAGVQAQVADLQAQESALKTYNLTDTSQLTKDASGNYVPTTAATNTILTNMGLSASTIASLSPAQQQTMATVGGVISASYTQNNPVPASFTAADLSTLMTEAQNDPTISQYYKDQLKTGQLEFENNFNALKASSDLNAAETTRTQALAQKNLQQQQAAAGMAYSGFREQATEELTKEQEAVVESSKQDIQSQLQSMGTAYEKQYGTAALPNLGSIEGISYSPIGGVTGTEAASQTADVTARYNELVNQEALTKGLTT